MAACRGGTARGPTSCCGLGSGLDDALAQRERDLAHPDARTMAELGFAATSGVLHSLASYLDGLKPDEADVRFLRSERGWLLPLMTPSQ